MNKMFKLSLFLIFASFNCLNAEDYKAKAKTWYKDLTSHLSEEKLKEEQLIAHFIYLVIQKKLVPSTQIEQKLNGVMNTCPINNDKICQPIFELSQESNLPGLIAYYDVIYKGLPEKNRVYDGIDLQSPESIKIK